MTGNIGFGGNYRTVADYVGLTGNGNVYGSFLQLGCRDTSYLQLFGRKVNSELLADIYAINGAIMRFSTGGKIVAIIDTVGRLGIGTQNPKYRLDVAGSVDVTGDADSVRIPNSVTFKRKWQYGGVLENGKITVSLGQNGWSDGGNLDFYTMNGNNLGTNNLIRRMRISDYGYVGIGKNPAFLFDVAGTIHSDSGISSNYGCYAYNNGDYGSYIGVFKNKGSLPGSDYENNFYPVLKTDNLYMYFSTNNKYIGGIGNDNTSTYLSLNNNTSTVQNVLISSNSKSYFNGGAVAIGTTDPGAFTLNVNGSLHATSGPWTSSDLRLKTNIDTITNSIETVQHLTGVYYNWKTAEYPDRNLPSGRQIGLIAQDVEKVLPEVVQTNTDGFKAVSYDKIVAVLIEAVKAQQQEIDSLKSVIIKTQSSITEINSKLQ